MVSGRTTDFTSGGILGKIVIFAVPIVLSEVLQNLYHVVDSMVAGNFVGGEALAAVSVCSAISQMVVGFFNGMSVGASVVASRYFGAGEGERLSAAMRTALAFSVILGALLSLGGIVAAPWLLRLIAVPEDVFADAAIYLRIYLAGVLFTVIYNVEAGLLRAIGDSRGTLEVLSTVCTLNIVLDLLFVTAFDFGVAGVSMATVISQMISVMMGYRRLKKHDRRFRLTFGELRREKKEILTIMGIGMPAGAQNSLISFSNLFVWRYITGFNSVVMAGVGAAQRIDRFVSLPCNAFGLALTTYVGQNVGARQSDRIRRGVRGTMFFSLGYCVLASFGLYGVSDLAMRLFNDSPEVIGVGVSMMRTLLPFYWSLALRQVLMGALRGYGDTKIPMLLSLLGMVALRQIYLAIALALDHRVVHIYIGYPLAWLATAAMMVVYYLAKRRGYEKFEDLPLERGRC
ncbi:MAG: MATE family efflux transporter [Pyramidobacter sp.]|jgi:putative MATE family efflux protein